MGDPTKNKLAFEEGVDSYIPYAGPLKDNLANVLIIVLITLANIPLSFGLQKLFEKLDLTKLMNKKKA